MLRAILLAVAISLVAGSIPAFAQNFAGSCRDLCLKNRCGHGSMNPNVCMYNCVAACKKKNPKAQD
jgi:hypothetical protein